MELRRFIIVIAGIVVFAFMLFYLFFYSAVIPTPGGNGLGNNPFGNPAGNATTTGGSTGSGSGTTGPTIPVTLNNGSTVAVPDFTQTNQPSYASATNGYQVAGADNADFQILYYPQNSGFNITLNKEPIGSVRLEAEAALRAQLRLTNTQLCALTVQVATTMDINPTYSGENLGLSFCPGAVVLPQ